MSRSSSPSNRKASAKAPRNRCSAARDRLDRRMPVVHSSVDQVGDDLGIGLGVENVALALSSSRSSRKFSMMPLWTTATRPVGVRVGVALGRTAVRRPAGVADADRAARAARCVEARLEIAQLALGAPARRGGRPRGWRRPAES